VQVFGAELEHVAALYRLIASYALVDGSGLAGEAG